FIEGMEQFGRVISGFNDSGVYVSGVESRTSSPVRIHRDETGQSSVKGLYPCGEGAGYAGGITSAAMDGILIAEKIAGEYYMK
ncbi:MAG: FAD-dependent oxidoreductase, partial [Lachnospiraceae bacterium]|nr:FAD-dependent oxidoreductase [Lachnospiraceae bacterium]